MMIRSGNNNDKPSHGVMNFVCKCSSRMGVLLRIVLIMTATFKEISGLRTLKVFLLAGQSNMEGHGYVDKKDEETGNPLNGTLEWMMQQQEYSTLKQRLKSSNGNEWRSRNDVWIVFNKQKRWDLDPVMNEHGELTAGPFGGDPRTNDILEIGPELGFGWTMGDAIKEQILLIKIAWGGMTLGRHFRPPSSGGTIGSHYQTLIKDIQATLANLTSMFDKRHQHNTKVEIAGFLWFQGWNDASNDTLTSEYEFNLANLIRDVRHDLNQSALPFVIGVSGMCGWDNDTEKPFLGFCKRSTNVIQAQFQVAEYPEFQTTVRSVETRNFYRDAKSSPGVEPYHWYNNCESYWLVGKAMAEAMLELLFQTTTIRKEKSLRPGT